MQDKLKQFVDEHRDELEVYQPRASLWNGIDERLHHGRHRTLWQSLAIAASLLLAVTCGTWIYTSDRDRSVSRSTTPAHPPEVEAQAYFTAILQMKDAELEQYCIPQPQLCNEFEKDIETLNRAYFQLKKEYAAAADKRAVLKAMTSNLQMQVQLISRQLEIMENVKEKTEAFKTI